MDPRAWLAAIVGSSQDAIFSKTLDGTILSWNAAAQRLFGYTADEMVGERVTRLIPPDRLDEEPRILRSVAAGESVEAFETKRLRKDGTLVDVWLTVSPVIDDTGAIVGASSINRDITARREREAQLERQRRELERSNAALAQFAYVASHDLQEPLRMVASYTQLLQRRYQGRLDADADEFIGYAVDGARRMQALIQDLLMYARVRSKPVEEGPVDMEGCLADALVNLRGTIDASGARIDSASLPIVSGNRTQLTQLLQNLVGNAIKFRSTEPPVIDIGVERTASGWTFQVRDNGIGIEPAYVERIFGIFQRLHGPGDYPGTGIGLALCREIVERHGGRIWAEKQDGPGATLCFTLPAKGGTP